MLGSVFLYRGQGLLSFNNSKTQIAYLILTKASHKFNILQGFLGSVWPINSDSQQTIGVYNNWGSVRDLS